MDEGPRRPRGSGGSDLEPRPKSLKGNKSSAKPTNGSAEVNEPVIALEVSKEPWQTQVPNNNAMRIDTIMGESWHEPQVISKEPYIAIKSPAHFMCSSLQTDLNTGNLESTWEERQPEGKQPSNISNMNPSDGQAETWQEGQASSKDHTNADRIATFNSTSRHTDVVSLAWQDAQIVGKDSCSSTLQSNNVEESWQETQAINKHTSNVKISLDSSQPEIIVGWSDMHSHPQAPQAHKDPSGMRSLQLNDASQRSDVAVEDSWQDLEPSNDGSDVHQPNDEGRTFSNDLACQKQEVGNVFAALLESVKNSEELDLVKKALAPLSDSFRSMRRAAVKKEDTSTLVPWWSKPY